MKIKILFGWSWKEFARGLLSGYLGFCLASVFMFIFKIYYVWYLVALFCAFYIAILIKSYEIVKIDKKLLNKTK